jgi:prepilin-type processing-associated H-X9-DG protein
MPYLESSSFYAIYSFKEPWDGPTNNRIILGQPITYREKGGALVTEVVRSPPVFQCPSATPPVKDDTSYVVVTGTHTLFPTDNVSVQFAQVMDGTSATLLVGEMDPPTIHWLEPRDLEFAKLPLQINARSRPCLSSGHGSGINAAMADGSVQFLPASTSAATLRSYLLISDATQTAKQARGGSE